MPRNRRPMDGVFETTPSNLKTPDSKAKIPSFSRMVLAKMILIEKKPSKKPIFIIVYQGVEVKGFLPGFALRGLKNIDLYFPGTGEKISILN